jgi:drug/metabolite transporter (DMT)-like permease
MIYGMMASLFWGLVTADWGSFALPHGRDWGLLLLAASVGFVANFFVIVSFQLAPASLSAPLRYLLLAWSALIGYLIWDQLPNFRAWIGIGMVLCAGFLAIASSLRPTPAVAQVQP